MDKYFIPSSTDCHRKVKRTYRRLIYRRLIYRRLIYRRLIYRRLIYRRFIYRHISGGTYGAGAGVFDSEFSPRAHRCSNNSICRF